MTKEDKWAKATPEQTYAVAIAMIEQRDKRIEKLQQVLLDAKAMGFFTVTNDSSVTHRDLCKKVDNLLEIL